MAPGIKTGGRKKGSKNKIMRVKWRKFLPRETYESLATLDRTGGKSMAEIQINWARKIDLLADAEHAKAVAAVKAKDLEDARECLDRATKYAAMATKIAHDVSPYLYPALQSIKHSGDEDAPPIRVENLSDYQLEKLIDRLSRG